MNLILFCTAFILQFVGHRMGDFLFQTHTQAMNKVSDPWARVRHCLVYSLTIAVVMLLCFSWWVAGIVFVYTYVEHFIVDSRKPIIWWKRTLERFVGNKDFKVEDLPLFVLIEIDQTVHYLRCFVFALLIGYGILS